MKSANEVGSPAFWTPREQRGPSPTVTKGEERTALSGLLSVSTWLVEKAHEAARLHGRCLLNTNQLKKGLAEINVLKTHEDSG